MLTVIKVGATAKEMFGNKIHGDSPKKLDANKYLGKVKWEEDPLEYQQRKREEWNEGSR